MKRPFSLTPSLNLATFAKSKESKTMSTICSWTSTTTRSTTPSGIFSQSGTSVKATLYASTSTICKKMKARTRLEWSLLSTRWSKTDRTVLMSGREVVMMCATTRTITRQWTESVLLITIGTRRWLCAMNMKMKCRWKLAWTPSRLATLSSTRTIRFSSATSNHTRFQICKTYCLSWKADTPKTIWTTSSKSKSSARQWQETLVTYWRSLQMSRKTISISRSWRARPTKVRPLRKRARAMSTKTINRLSLRHNRWEIRVATKEPHQARTWMNLAQRELKKKVKRKALMRKEDGGLNKWSS